AALVAAQADLGARVVWRLRMLGEADIRFRPRAAARRLLQVRFALAVAAGAGGRALVRPRAVLGLADQQHVAVVLVVARRALGVAVQHLVDRLVLLGRRLAFRRRRLVLRRHSPGEERQQEGDAEEFLHLATLSSFGPGPSGSLCAMPKWQSMQVVPSAFAFAWRARAVSLCFSGSIAAVVWQLRHSCESFFFMRVHSRTAMV